MEQILIEMYKQSNEFIRSSDDKRDQIIAFYILIISIVFGSLDKLGIQKEFVGIATGLLGLIIALIIISLRKWHIIYVNTAIVLQYFVATKTKPTEKAIENTWNKLISNHKPITNKKVFKPLSTETLTFIAFLFIAFTPFYLVSLSYYTLGLHLIYIIAMNVLGNLLVNRETGVGHGVSWILRLKIQR